MHAIWDSVIYDYCGYPDLPLSGSDWTWYSSEAASLITSFPVDETKTFDSDFKQWADESLLISQQYVYEGFVEGQVPSTSYQDRAEPELKSRMMMGARRLANEVIAMYNA